MIRFLISCFLDMFVALYTFCCTGVQSEVVRREIINNLKSRGVGYRNADNSRNISSKKVETRLIKCTWVAVEEVWKSLIRCRTMRIAEGWNVEL